MKAQRVTAHRLEAMWGAAVDAGKDAALELGHPTRDFLVVDGSRVAYAPKPLAAPVTRAGDRA